MMILMIIKINRIYSMHLKILILNKKIILIMITIKMNKTSYIERKKRRGRLKMKKNKMKHNNRSNKTVRLYKMNK